MGICGWLREKLQMMMRRQMVGGRGPGPWVRLFLGMVVRSMVVSAFVPGGGQCLWV